MKIVKSSYKIEDKINGNEILERIERAGRTCYKSEKEITAYSAKKFVKMLFETGHESVLEHEKITVRVTCDRGLSHEIVRHRIASYSQESTRYCNYSKSKFGNEIVLIQPAFWNSKSPEDKEKLELWKKSMDLAEKVYMKLIELGATPQEARSVLPNSLKTEIVMTMNLREWRHFFKLRTSYSAHPQMRELFRPMLNEFKKQIPVVFDDITY